jgi:hypothetical protein
VVASRHAAGTHWRAVAGPADSPDERDAIELSDAILYRHAFGLASDLAKARSHRLAGRLHDAPGAGGEATEVREEVRRRGSRVMIGLQKCVPILTCGRPLAIIGSRVLFRGPICRPI